MSLFINDQDVVLVVGLVATSRIHLVIDVVHGEDELLLYGVIKVEFPRFASTVV